jgi:hypothetical protein
MVVELENGACVRSSTRDGTAASSEANRRETSSSTCGPHDAVGTLVHLGLLQRPAAIVALQLRSLRSASGSFAGSIEVLPVGCPSVHPER